MVCGCKIGLFGHILLPRPMECGTWPTNILARLETPASSSRLADQLHVHDEHPAALAASLSALFEPLVAVYRPTLANCMNASILIALDCFSIELYMIRFTFYPPGCSSYWPTPPSVIAAGRLTAAESNQPPDSATDGPGKCRSRPRGTRPSDERTHWTADKNIEYVCSSGRRRKLFGRALRVCLPRLRHLAASAAI